MIGICAICETQHELELLESGVEEGAAWEDYLCPVTGETFTHLHSPTYAAPDAACAHDWQASTRQNVTAVCAKCGEESPRK